MPTPDDDNDHELVPIPLDRESIARLARLGREVRQHPARVAASLLRDLLRDDELENVRALAPERLHS